MLAQLAGTPLRDSVPVAPGAIDPVRAVPLRDHGVASRRRG